MTESIAVVGGGLAGLAAANALAAFGFAADVFERSSTLAEIGAGINISPQAVTALRAIGLGDKLAAVANIHAGIFSRDMYSGEQLARLHLDHGLTDIEESQSGARLTFANGAVRRADVVIGADGIHSVVRRALYGDDNPTYTGQMVWHMHDRIAQKAILAHEDGFDSMAWICGYDPVAGWNQPPAVPAIE
jgi:salicylate hydroxylase